MKKSIIGHRHKSCLKMIHDMLHYKGYNIWHECQCGQNKKKTKKRKRE